MVFKVIPAAAASVLALAVLALPGGAGGQSDSPSYQNASLTFTTTAPGSPSGLGLAIDYRDPANPEGKPHAVQKLVLRLAPGSKIDTGVPGQCKASDGEFAQQGASACPSESKLGVGQTEFDSGGATEPRIVKTDVTMFNNEAQLILLFETTNQPTQVRVAARSTIEDATITTNVPPLPGAPPPDPYLAVKTVRETFETVTRGSGDSVRSYVTTPAACPARGYWTNTLEFTYRNGVTQTVPTKAPCVTPSGSQRVRLHLRLSDRKGRLRASGRCAVGRVRATVVGRDRRKARRAVFYRDRRRVAYDRRPPLSRVVDRGQQDGRSRRHRVRVHVRMRDGDRVRVARRYRACAADR
jgi:hypothetical protein